MGRFAIIANARTGSSALAAFFRDLGLHVHPEPFRPSKWGESNPPDYIVELSNIYSRGAHAIKHLTNHCSIEDNIEIVTWLMRNGINVVHLHRKNKAMNAISFMLAMQHEQWELDRKDVVQATAYDEMPVGHIPVDWIREHIAKQDEMNDVLVKLLPPSHLECPILHYEDFFGGVPFGILEQRVLNLLIILDIYIPPDSSIEYLVREMIREHFSPDGKQNPPSIYYRIPNWLEIQQEFGIDL